MAIIDILTPYDAKKKAAHAAKTVKHGVSFLSSFRPSGWVLRPLGRGSGRAACLVAWRSLCHYTPFLGNIPSLFFPLFSGPQDFEPADAFPQGCWACYASC